MKTLVLLFAIIQLSLANGNEVDVIELSLNFHRLPVKILKMRQEHVHQKWGKLILATPNERDDGLVASNPGHSFITTKVGINSPKKEFEVMLNLNSQQLWVFSKTYKYLLKNQNYYDFSYSQTSYTQGKTFNQMDETFFANGTLYYDTIKVGNVSYDFSVFGVATNVSNSFDELFPFEGAFGIDVLHDVKESFFQRVVYYNKKFSLELRKKCEDVSSSYHGKLVIGKNEQCNRAPTESITFPFEKSINGYVLKATSVEYLKDSYKSNTGGFVLIDPTTSNTLLKPNDLKAIFETVKVNFDYDIGLYTINCNDKDQLATLRFNFNNNQYIYLDLSRNLIDLNQPDERCALTLALNDESHVEDYVLGIGLLLQGNKVTFDLEQKTIMVC